MRSAGWRRFALAALAPVILLVSACGQGASADSGDTTVLYPDPAERPGAPQLAGEDLAGDAFDAKTLDGSVVVVNFWASWCAPCRREGPGLVEVYEATKDSGVEFVGINVRDDREKAVAFEHSLGVEYPSIFDPSGRLALEFTEVPPNTIPATLILDSKGRIAAVFRQELTANTLSDAITDVAAA